MSDLTAKFSNGLGMFSYADQDRRARYVSAMRALAQQRPEGALARLYVSAPTALRRRSNWDRTLKEIRGRLAGRAELFAFEDAFFSAESYAADWAKFAGTLDGLVLVGRLRDAQTYRLGLCARRELLSVAQAGRPILLNTHRGLVPLVDCQPNRHGPEGQEMLDLTIPAAYRNGETLRAAREALSLIPAQQPQEAGAH